MPKPVLLTVDDDAAVLSAVVRDLRKHYGRDYRILRTDSGIAALDMLRELKERGDPVALVLSDQRMPKMDGVTFLSEAMKFHPESKRALLTAYADTEAAIGAINKSQVDYYLLKPWDPPEERLYPVLDDMLDEWRAAFRPGYGGVRVIGDRWSARCHRIRDFLARNQVPYQFLDVESSDEARALAASTAADPIRMPLVILPGGERLAAPESAEIAEHIGLKRKAEQRFYDLAIVGAGPAGLASAVYGGSEGLRTLLIEREAPGGQAGTSSRIENYLGFPGGLSGGDLARRAVTQARKFGVEILTPQETTALRVDGPYKLLTLADGSEISCHVLVLAMGVSWKLLSATGADRLAGFGGLLRRGRDGGHPRQGSDRLDGGWRELRGPGRHVLQGLRRPGRVARARGVTARQDVALPRGPHRVDREHRGAAPHGGQSLPRERTPGSSGALGREDWPGRGRVRGVSVRVSRSDAAHRMARRCRRVRRPRFHSHRSQFGSDNALARLAAGTAALPAGDECARGLRLR